MRIAAVCHGLAIAAVAVPLLRLRGRLLLPVLRQRSAHVVRLAEPAAAAAADKPLVRSGIDQFARPSRFPLCHHSQPCNAGADILSPEVSGDSCSAGSGDGEVSDTYDCGGDVAKRKQKTIQKKT